MGKKRRAGQERSAALMGNRNGGNPQSAIRNPQLKRPRILFAVGDADHLYTEGKIWRLVRRLQDHTGWEVVGVTNDQDAGKAGKEAGVQVWQVPIESPGLSVEERLQATDEMVRKTADLCIPGSHLPLWKVLAMDDFLSSLQLFGAQPTVPVEADLIIVPLMCVDNNTKGSAGLYCWLLSQAQQQGIPVLAVEVSPLGNKNTLSHLPANYYAVKSEWAKNFLLREGIASAAQVSILKHEEAYLLWPGQDEYVEAYLEREPRARELLNIAPQRFVVFIPHHVAFLWEVRNILQALTRVPGPLSVVIQVNPHTIRRQYREREIVQKTYDQELRALPHVVVDERVGAGLLIQLADLLISPFAGSTTERTVLCRKPAIICQAMGEEGWGGECLYWEPQPDKIPDLIQTWRERGLLGRTRLANLVTNLLPQLARAAA